MGFDIAFGHRQRVGGQVSQDHLRLFKGMGAGYTDTATAGTQIEDAQRVALEPGLEAVRDHFGNR